MSSFTFDSIDDAIDDIRQGKIVIVCDALGMLCLGQRLDPF